MERAPRRIALLGAESTGKTQLAAALGAALAEAGQAGLIVTEVLREWCERMGRTPGRHEQQAIAEEQARRVLDAGPGQVVIADTTPLMTAIYSHLLFADESLYGFALEHQRCYDLTLVTGLDLPWIADGLQRDGPHVREPVDALVRAALTRAGLPFQVIYGHGEARVRNALNAISSIAEEDRGTGTMAPKRPQGDVWTWVCDTCSDPACEHRLFSELLRR